MTTTGLPLGVLKADFSAPVATAKANKKKAKDLPIEEKKTFFRIEGLRDCMELKAQMPHTRIVNVSGREADFFEVFDEQRRQCARVELLVRAKHNRGTTGNPKLFDTVRHSSIRSEFDIAVPRQSARAKKSKQKARAKQSARVAKVSLRYRRVELSPPPGHKD